MSNLNKKRVLLITALLGFVGWKLYKKVQDADKLSVDIDSADTQASRGILPNIRVTLLVKNPTGSTIKINSIKGDLFINNVKVGYIHDFVPVTIVANSATKLPIVFVPEYLNAMDIVTTLVINSLNAPVTFNGTIIADSFTIPITKTFKLLN